MKPVKNTILTLCAGHSIRCIDWPRLGNELDYYEVDHVTMEGNVQRIHLKDFDVSYLLTDITKWEWK